MTTTGSPPRSGPAGAAAFADRVRPHLPAMARLAARLAPATDRDDVMQEALVRAWTKWHQYDMLRGASCRSCAGRRRGAPPTRPGSST